MSSVCVNSLACAASFLIFFRLQRMAASYLLIRIACGGHNSVLIMKVFVYEQQAIPNLWTFVGGLCCAGSHIPWFCSARSACGVWPVRRDF